MNRFLTGQFYLNTILAIIGIFNSFQVSAQVIPDNTLGSENSTVNRNSSGGDVIDGGAIRGSNLFHSFEKFSIPNGGSVLFNNTTNIQNIINRVTGGSVSDINGLISANGTANLFLVNPNGITFGTGAALNIGGSFFATTASGVRFSDGSIFSANSTQSSPLLTVSTPIGLQLGTRENIKNSDSGNIIVNSLSIQNAATLNLLAANNLEINNANLQLPSGRLGIILEADSDKSGQGNIKTMDSTIQTNGGVLSLTAAKEISLNNTMLKSDNNSNNPARDITLKADDISFNNDTSIQSQTFSSGNAATANIDANTLTIEGGGINNISQGSGHTGLINISADNISLTNGASLLTEAQGEGNSRDINIAVTNNFNITGIYMENNSRIRSLVTKTSLGKTGNINISANNNLSLDKGVILNEDNSQIDNQPQNSKINGSINIDSKSINAKNSSLILALTFSNGKGGDININKNIKTGSLRYENGGGIIARTGDENNSGRGGDAGNINITADSVSLIGGGVSNFSVGIGSQTFNNGNAGNLNIKTGSFLIENIAGIDTNSFKSNTVNTTLNKGNAGNINITADSLTLKDRGGIGSSTLTAGKGGNITINSRLVTLKDEINRKNEIEPSSRSNISSNTGIAATANGPRIQKEATGNAGQVSISADEISLNNAEITGATAAFGNGGIISIDTNTLKLNNNSSISVSSQANSQNILTAGQPGNIQIDINNLLLLRNQSNISSTAGNEQSPSNGGNIQIKTPVLVAAPNQNSDITANAFRGQGGKIKINTQGIFGIAVSPINTTGNDITAFSQTDPSLNGIIAINVSGIDPSQRLVDVPVIFVDAHPKIVASCSRNNQSDDSQFIITGRGGLPPSPNDPLGGEVIWEDARIFSQVGEKTNRETVGAKTSNNSSVISSTPLPATGWVFNNKGEVRLISQNSNSYGFGFNLNHIPCGEGEN
jgi:filamentous hemagglutinin family protein